ncbi:NADPH-dependent assimilatory sulfite reductase hemoprotein subunit [Dictyobacter aurantiacus]|uniref:assimilatory sulfite reductase (NADPH) n=1 Tax=Dictyobacter aurantiacus TaxID=1936993 RepID=A0A401ZG16_9CHLR|nr:NADPH-dependent assimilatory sulfite reductase hemoprotein subunit [Dictyobacter aurantiacus]GCE05789.1 sulfite reductase subunit beta [Dictyobacter aurantiacus]
MSTPDQDKNELDKTLLHLGPGEGSKVEHIKVESNYLRGQIVEELAQDTPRFTEDQVQLIKFHGMYQQEDRDARQARKAAGAEKAYQFMIRSRIPGGALTADQYLVQDDLSERYGNHTMRITTRQSFQLHGILKGNIHATINEINKSLLSTLAACGDVNRNVMACPAPVSSRAQAQIQEIAHKLAMHLAPKSSAYHEIWLDGEKVASSEEPEVVVEPMYGTTYLPRKFKVGVLYPGDNCIDAFTQDIAFIARVEDEQLVGFTAVIGGGMGATHGKKETFPRLGNPLADVSVDQVLKVAETIITVQRDYGDRTNRRHARMKYVVEERGIPWFRQQVEERLGYQLSDPSEVHFHDVDHHLGWHQQHDGNWFLGLHIENGRLRDTETLQLKSGLRTVIKEFRPNIRLTAQQNILLIDIPKEQRAAIEARLQGFGIETDAEAIGAYRYAMACPALPTCGLAVAEAERALPGVVKQLEANLQELGLDGEKISFRMTGCPNGCARPYMGDVGFVGRSRDLYNVHVGGDWQNTRLNTIYAQNVNVKDIPSVLSPLFTLWRDEREAGEGFGDFCHRIGVEQLKERAAAQPVTR